MTKPIIKPYVSRYAESTEYHTKQLQAFQAAVKLAYPNLAENKYINGAELALYWTKELEKTEYLISLANILGLVYFGLADRQHKYLFTLGFKETTKLELYLKEIGWGTVYKNSLGNTICLMRGLRKDFICSFWAGLSTPAMHTQTVKAGITPAYLIKQQTKQQKKVNTILGADASAFNLLAANLS